MSKDIGRLLALIPAKEGSERLKRKNIRLLAGKTLLERAIVSARKTNLFSRIIVSTESDRVAAIAREINLDIPFMRPPELSRDPAGVVEVALHALEELERLGQRFDTLVILLPTSPFRKSEDILGAIRAYKDLGVNFLMSVVKESKTPLSSLVREGDFLSPLHPDWLNKTGSRITESTPELFRSNGAITVVDVNRFREEKNYYSYPLGAYEMPLERSLDIDSEYDFSFAEFLAARHPEWLDE